MYSLLYVLAICVPNKWCYWNENYGLFCKKDKQNNKKLCSYADTESKNVVLKRFQMFYNSLKHEKWQGRDKMVIKKNTWVKLDIKRYIYVYFSLSIQN